MKHKRSYTLKDIYALEWEDKEGLSGAQFNKIARTFNHLLARYLIETGNEVRMLNGLGRLRIIKNVTKDYYDFPYYMKTGDFRFSRNKHSMGYHAKFDWDYLSPRARFKFQGLWRFHATRSHKRYLSRMIKDHNYILKYFDNEN